MQPLTATLFVLLLASAPLSAAETAWIEIAPDASARLVSSDTVTGDSIWMGLEIDMPADTKTYWRVPGETGIPLSIDASSSLGFGDPEVSWPFPQRETQGGYVDHVYYGRVLIPFRVPLLSEPARFRADIMLGVCSDICIPAQASFEIVPDTSKPDTPNAFRIKQALAGVPLIEDKDDIVGEVRFDGEQGAIVVDAIAPHIDPQTMIAEIEGELTAFDVPHPAGQGAALVFPILGRIAPETLQGARMRFSYLAADGPYEITRPLILP